ncbi:MAG: ion channel [Actinomycetota bacterium]|nr:ion channel [Actinomycetota bacterium]
MAKRTPTLTPKGQHWVSVTARLLDALAVVFLIDLLLIWSLPDASSGITLAFDLIAWLVWAGFAVDYFVRLSCSKPKSAFVATHKLDLLMVLLPMLRILRVFLLLRKSLASVSTEKIAGSIGSLVIVVVFVSSFLEWQVEKDAADATITSFRTALWWAVVTTTTVGYGDYTPVTPTGRLIAIVVMMVGIGLIGTISATVASWFVKRPNESNPPEVAEGESAATPAAPQAHAELLARLDRLTEQQEEIRALLISSPPGSMASKQ